MICCVATTAAAQPRLATIGIAGAWRLGRWDLLKRYLGTAAACQEVLSSEEVWEMRIGKLLSSISSRYAVPPPLGHAQSVCLELLDGFGINNHTHSIHGYIFSLQGCQHCWWREHALSFLSKELAPLTSSLPLGI